MATDIDTFLDGPDPVDAFLDAPTPNSQMPSKAAMYKEQTDENSAFTNFLVGLSGAAEGWKMALAKLLGRPPSDEEVTAYREAMRSLEGTAGGVGAFTANMLPGLATGGFGAAGLTGLPAALTLAGISGATSAAQGALEPTLSTESVAENAAKSGAFGFALPLGIGAVTKAGQKTYGAVKPFFSKEAQQLAGGKMLNTVAGDKTPEILRSLRTTPPTISPLTAGQASAAAGSPEFSAFTALVSGSKPDVGKALKQAQIANRQVAIQSFAQTPEALAAAVEARKVADAANYSAANVAGASRRRVAETTVMPPKTTTVRDSTGYPTTTLNAPTQIPLAPVLQKLQSNSVFNAAKADAQKLAKARIGLPEEYAKMPQPVIDDIIADPTRSVEGLHLMKLTMDEHLKMPIEKSALSGFSSSAVKGVKNSLLAAMPDEYQTARIASREAAQKIGQMQVGQKALSVLDQPLGEGERGAMLANIVNKEKPLVNAASGNTATSIDQVLEPVQLAKLNNVINELNIDRTFADQAREGAKSATVRKALAGTIDLPHFLNQGVILANAATRKFYGGGRDKTFAELAKILQDPVETAKIMEKATKREQNAIRFLVAAQQGGAMVAPGIVNEVQK
jgi:hypothetical protein